MRPASPGPDERTFADVAAVELPRARRAAYLMCGDWAEAEDLAQQALVRLYGVWSRLDRRDSVRAYVTTTLTRLWLDELRRRRRRPLTLVADVPEVAGDDGMPDGERDRLLAALAQVPPRQRACLVLRYWEDLGVRETAAALGCSEGTVKSLTHHGVRAMRARLGVLDDHLEDPR